MAGKKRQPFRKFLGGLNDLLGNVRGVITDADKLTTIDVNTSNEVFLTKETMANLALLIVGTIVLVKFW